MSVLVGLVRRFFSLFHRHAYDTLLVQPGLIQVACWCGAKSPGVRSALIAPPALRQTPRLIRFRRRLRQVIR